MTYMILFLAGLAFSATPVDGAADFKNSFTCYEQVVKAGKNEIVEGFYLKDGRPQPLDQLIDPVVRQLRTDKRINSVGKEGLKKIQEDLLRSYPCNVVGGAFNSDRSLNGTLDSYKYTCFPREDGVYRVETKKYLELKEHLDTLNNNAGANPWIFNYYIKFASSSIYADAKLLEPSFALTKQIDAASRSRIKGTRSLKSSLEDSVCSDSVKKAAKTPAEYTMPKRSRPGRR